MQCRLKAPTLWRLSSVYFSINTDHRQTIGGRSVVVSRHIDAISSRCFVRARQALLFVVQWETATNEQNGTFSISCCSCSGHQKNEESNTQTRCRGLPTIYFPQSKWSREFYLSACLSASPFACLSLSLRFSFCCTETEFLFNCTKSLPAMCEFQGAVEAFSCV